MELEFESAPRDNTRRTIVVRSITRLAVFILKLLYAGCVTFCRRHTPVCAAVVVSLSIGRRRSRGDRPTVAVAASCGPPDVATGPAGKCPPVCQRATFLFTERRNYTLSRRWAQEEDFIKRERMKDVQVLSCPDCVLPYIVRTYVYVTGPVQPPV